jgi:integrase
MVKKKKDEQSQEKPRRARGEGSVFQRESDGRWVARIPIGGGKRKEEYYDTKREAERAKRRMLNERDAGRLVTEREQTFEEYIEYWLKAHRSPLRLGTNVTYSVYLRTRVIPVLGHVKLQKLTIDLFQSLYQDWEDELSPNTIRSIHGVIHKALNDAVKWRKLVYNPVHGIDLPKASKAKNVYMLTEEEVERFLQCIESVRLYPLFRIALLLGMRLGELCGLKWSDINLEKGVLQIQRTVSYLCDPDVGHYAFYEGPPKTKAGERTIHLSRDVVKMLCDHRQRQEEIRARVSRWKDLDLVFCTRFGNYLIGNDIRRLFDKLLALAGLKHMKFHALRHNANLILRRMGVDPVVRKEMLGHEDLATTDGVYGYSTLEMHKQVAEMMDRLFGDEEN